MKLTRSGSRKFFGQYRRKCHPGMQASLCSKHSGQTLKCFLLLSKEVSRVKPYGAGIMEMDVKMQALRLDPRVTTFLLPLQKPNALPVHPPPDPESAVGVRLTKRLKKKRS